MFAIFAALAAGCGGQDRPAAAVPAQGAPPEAYAHMNDGPRAADGAGPDAALVPLGEKLFQTKGCSGCHTFGRKLTGPDLAGVTHRRTATWIQSQILHPVEMVKNDSTSHALFAIHALQMPNQGLTPDEAKSVLNYFLARDRASAASH